jgi:uncharacterized membrane protein YphA (DoxX/SURF4 family)
MRKNLPMILVRLMVGAIFLIEGILKFTQPAELGVGRFTHIGLPLPGVLAPLVAVVEIVCGAALVLGLYAGDAALALLVVILVALVTTKVPILLGHSLGRFAPPQQGRYGFFSFMHEARTDLCMLLGTVAILIDSGIKLGRRKQWYQR